jgi:hypothetical protein
MTAVRAAGAAFLGAGAKRFVDDGLDGARAAAAFGAAAEATVNLLGIPRQVRAALTALRTSWSLRTLQEQTIMKPLEPLCDASSSIFKSATRCKRKSRNFKQFQTEAGEILE